MQQQPQQTVPGAMHQMPQQQQQGPPQQPQPGQTLQNFMQISSEPAVQKLRVHMTELKQTLTTLMKVAAEVVVAVPPESSEMSALESQASSGKSEEFSRTLQDFYAVCDQIESTFCMIANSQKLNTDYQRLLVNTAKTEKPEDNFQAALQGIYQQLSICSAVHEHLCELVRALEAKSSGDTEK